MYKHFEHYFYVENESGATLVRPKLMQLIENAHRGDIILVEQIDRLARLNQADWDTLKRMLSEKNLSIVSKELPTSYMALQSESSTEFMSSVLQAINSMMLDLLVAIARNDYEEKSCANALRSGSLNSCGKATIHAPRDYFFGSRCALSISPSSKTDGKIISALDTLLRFS